MTTLPPNYLRLSSKWLETNPLPEDAMLLSNDRWVKSTVRGLYIHPMIRSNTYATARTDLPREAYADERAEESKTPEVDAAIKRFFAWLDNESESICPPNGWEIARTMEREVATLRTQLDAKEGELRRIKAPSVDEGSLKGLKIEYNDIDNRFYVYAADGSFLWSGDAFFNAWQCARLTAELDAIVNQLARRTALDGFATTGEKISALLKVAAVNDPKAELAKALAELGAVRKERDAEVHQTEAFIRALGYGWSGAKTIEDRQEFLKAIHQSYLRWIEWKDAAQARCGALERAFVALLERPRPIQISAAELAQFKALLTPSQQPDKESEDDPEGVFWEHLPEALSKIEGGDALCAKPEIQSNNSPVSNPQPESPIPSGVGQPSRLEPVKAGEWLPIESAPKDGTYFLVGWFADEEPDPERFTTVVAFYGQILGTHLLSVPGKYHIGPQATHWQPLPAPPIAPEGKATEGQ